MPSSYHAVPERDAGDTDGERKYHRTEDPLIVSGRVAGICFLAVGLLLAAALILQDHQSSPSRERLRPASARLARLPDHSHHHAQHEHGSAAGAHEGNGGHPETTEEPSMEGHDMEKMLKEEAALGSMSHTQHQHCPTRSYFLQGEPKSGTTWVEIVVDQLIDAAHALCENRPEWPCTVTNKGFDRTLRSANKTCGPFRFDDIEFIRSEKHNLPIRDGFFGLEGAKPANAVHLREHGCLDELIQNRWEKLECSTMTPPEETPVMRYIVIFRDPRANVVSAFHFFGKDDNIDQYARESITGFAERLAFRYYWFTHMVPGPNRLLLFYEDLLANPLLEYEKISDFMCLGLSREQLQRIVKATSFDAMKEMEKNHELPRINRPGTDQAKVRSGEVDSFKKELAPETLEFLDQEMKRVMQPEFYRRYLDSA